VKAGGGRMPWRHGPLFLRHPPASGPPFPGLGGGVGSAPTRPRKHANAVFHLF